MNFQDSSSNNRPFIKVKKDKIDWILDSVTIIGFIFIWIYIVFHFTKLPDTIPTHFNLKGDVDGYGSKYTLWILPSVNTFLFILFRIMFKYPHKFNYIVKITTENAEKQYRLALRSMRIILMNITLLFGLIIAQVVEGAYQNNSMLDWWFIPLLLLSIITPTIYMILASTSSKMK